MTRPCRQSREQQWELRCKELHPFLWGPHFLLTRPLVSVLARFVGVFVTPLVLNPFLPGSVALVEGVECSGPAWRVSQLGARARALRFPSERGLLGHCVCEGWPVCSGTRMCFPSSPAMFLVVERSLARELVADWQCYYDAMNERTQCCGTLL